MAMEFVRGKTFHSWGGLELLDPPDSLETRVLPEVQLTPEQREPLDPLDIPARLGITEPLVRLDLPVFRV